jgi:hypothetical protein
MGDTTVDLIFRVTRNRKLHRLTVSNTDCTDPQETADALVATFAQYGQVVMVAPRYWSKTHMHTGAWHVTIVAESATPPPVLMDILGQSAYVDIPGVRRICRYCESSVHIKDNCRAGQLAKRIARESQLAAVGMDVADFAEAAPHNPAPADEVGTPPASSISEVSPGAALSTDSTAATSSMSATAGSTPLGTVSGPLIDLGEGTPPPAKGADTVIPQATTTPATGANESMHATTADFQANIALEDQVAAESRIVVCYADTSSRRSSVASSSTTSVNISGGMDVDGSDDSVNLVDSQEPDAQTGETSAPPPPV